MSAFIGAGLLWNGAPHPGGRTDYPAPYRVGTRIGEYLRVESLIRVTDGRLIYLVNNLGPKWARRKCWSCGNRFLPDKARACTYCFTPLRDLRMLMTVRWNRRLYAGYEQFVALRLNHIGLLTPVAVYYRDRQLLSIHHYNGEGLLLDEPGPFPVDRLVAMAHFLCRMLHFLHEHGVVLRRLGPENLLIMPDNSVRLFDLDVREVLKRPSDLARHPKEPIRRDVARLGELLLPFCPPENEALSVLVERAATGRVADVNAFRRGLEALTIQGEVQPVTSRASAYTDQGLVRDHNEDAWSWRRLSEHASLYVVGDGMGGHAAGDVASKVATRTVTEAMATLPDRPVPDAVGKMLGKAFLAANRAVREHGEATGARMGTTLVAAVVLDNRVAVIANTGDSRAWLFRNGSLTQLTKDHTVSQDLLDAGQINAQQARVHPRANVLTATIGAADKDLEVALAQVSLKPGDRLLLATDGLWHELEDRRIVKVLDQSVDRRQAIRELVREVYDIGGRDNLTLMLIDV